MARRLAEVDESVSHYQAESPPCRSGNGVKWADAEPVRECAAMSSPAGSSVSEILSVGGIELEVLRRGTGRPMLLLHGFQNVDPRAPFLDGLGRHAEIIAPSHPGF